MGKRIIRADEYYDTVNVDDYYDKVHRTTWARRTAGFLGGATMGLVYGGAIGAIGAFVPHILTLLGVAGASAVAWPALLGAGGIFMTAAGCACVGAFLGLAINADVSANTASIAAGLEEMEKRHKVERLQDGAPVHDPKLPVVPGDEPKSAHIAPHTRLFSWKVAAVTMTLFAAFGAILAFAGAAPAIAMLGMHGTAGIVGCAALFSMFGSLMAVKNSLISNKAANFYFKLITDQYFDPSPKKEQVSEVIPVKAGKDAAIDAPLNSVPARSFADSVKRTSLADIITTREQGAQQDIAPSR